MTRVVCVAQGMAAGNNRSRTRSACPPNLLDRDRAMEEYEARNAINGLIISAEDAGVESHRERHSSRWSLDVGRVVDARLRRPRLSPPQRPLSGLGQRRTGRRLELLRRVRGRTFPIAAADGKGGARARAPASCRPVIDGIASYQAMIACVAADTGFAVVPKSIMRPLRATKRY